MTTFRATAAVALSVIALSSLIAQPSVVAHADPPEPDFSLSALRSGATRVTELDKRLDRDRAQLDTGVVADNRDLGVKIVESAGYSGVANVSLLEGTSPAAAAVGHGEGVTVSWDPEPQVDHYVVTRDEVIVATVEGGVWLDTDAPSGKLLSYRINPVTYDQSFAASHGVDVVRPEVGQEAAAAAEIIQVASTRFQTSVTWKSFIRQAYIDSPGTAVCSYSTAYKFGGDNRGFNNGYPYRTMIQAVVNWNNGGSLSYQKGSAPTTVYRKSDGALVATRTAPSSGLTAQRLAQSSATRVELYFTKKSTNPFCTKVPNAIEGFLRIAVTRAGSYTVLSGKHLQMPAHEIYVADRSRKTVYTRAESSPLCLQKLVCTPANIVGNGSYS